METGVITHATGFATSVRGIRARGVNPNSPVSQKADACPISFVLVDETGSAESVGPDLTLYIRPEELTRTDPSRITTQQTLGKSIWADNFGPGITTINISGHTGWRQDNQTPPMDGRERFAQLKNRVFDEWHRRRAEAVAKGIDPDKIKLIFANKLDNYAAIVAPMNFTLRRSKSRPLLMQYQIAMTVLDWDLSGEHLGEKKDKDGVTSEASRKIDAITSKIESLRASIEEIAEQIVQVRDAIDSKILTPVTRFMETTNRLYLSVYTAIAAGDSVADSLMAVARTSAQAGMNLFRTAASVVNLPQHARAKLMQVAGAYSNIFCLLRGSLEGDTYPDYSYMFGASNCSSTSGGRPISPLAGENPFYYVSPTEGVPPVTVTVPAQQGLQQLATSDVVLAPFAVEQLGSAAGAIAGGLVFS